MADERIDATGIEVLRFLLRTRYCSDRTLAKIKDRCHLSMPGVAVDALSRLSAQGMVTRVADHYDLTPAGMAMARKADPAPPSSTVVNFNGPVQGSEVRLQSEGSPASRPDTRPLNALQPKPAAPHHHTPVDASYRAADRGGMALPAASEVTVDLSLPKRVTYPEHPDRHTDTSFAQNERVANNPDIRVHFVLTYEDTPAALPLPIVDTDRMGRERTNDICLNNDVGISREHCRFNIKKTRNGVELYVQDLQSRNGTWVNGERLKPGAQARLAHGDLLKVGETRMIVSQLAIPQPIGPQALKRIQQERTVQVSPPILPPATAPRPAPAPASASAGSKLRG